MDEKAISIVHSPPELQALQQEVAALQERLTTFVQREADLQQQVDRLRLTHEWAPDAFMFLRSVRDAEGRIVDFVWEQANPAAARLLGRPIKALVGHRLSQLFSGVQTSSALFIQYQQVVETGAPLDQELYYNADGINSWFHIKTIKVGDGVAIFFSDITARKRLEEIERQQADVRQRESEARYHALFENANDGIAIVNLDRTIVNINKAMEKILGRSRAELIGQDYYVVLTPAGRALSEERERRLRAREKIPSLFEHEFLRKDGSTVWVESRIRFIKDSVGTPIGFQGIYRDISERRQAQEALRRSQEQYQTLINSIDGTIWEVDVASFLFTFVSPQAERLLGYPVEAWLEPNFWENHIHPDDRDWAVNFCLTQTQEHQTHQFEYRMLTADGRVIWVHDLVSVARENGHPVKLYGVMTDITLRKQAEEALRASEQRFQTFMQHSPAIAFIKDAEGRLQYVNLALLRAFNLSTIDWQGKTDFELWPLAVAHQLRANDVAILASGHPQTVEETIPQGDGDHQWVVWKFPFHDQEGRLLLGGMGIDLTEQKRMQSHLQQAQKLEAVGVLAGGIAHEFNNILAIMMGGVDLALDDVPPSSRTHENLTEVYKAGQRAKALVQQLLTFSRPTQEDHRVLNFQSLVEETLRLLRFSLPKTVQLSSTLTCPNELVLANAPQLEQVVLNLCLNGVQALPGQTGDLTIALHRIEAEEPGLRTIVGLDSGPYVRLTVRDTGGGIPPETLPRVFDPFFSTKPVGQGTGLGLAVVHSIVTAHHGVVQAESRLGEGAAFHVYLPILPTSSTSSGEKVLPLSFLPTKKEQS